MDWKLVLGSLIVIVITVELLKYFTKVPEKVVCRFCGDEEFCGNAHNCASLQELGYSAQNADLTNETFFVSLKRARETNDWCYSSKNFKLIPAKKQNSQESKDNS